MRLPRSLRNVLWAVKHVIDKARPYCDLYGFYLNRLPGDLAGKLNRLLARIEDSATVSGPISVGQVHWLQVNGGAQVGSISLLGDFFLLVERNVEAEAIDVNTDCIVTKRGILKGTPLKVPQVTISLDFEAAVALAQASGPDYLRLKPQWNSRPAAKRLADILLKHQLPATWAVCGHLFLESCRNDHGFCETNERGDWFADDPGTDGQQNPEWYMPEFIRWLLGEPLFEVGYHTFGHFPYGHVSRHTIARDLEYARTIADEWGIQLQSFVFPYNETDQVLEVAGAGFRNLRGSVGGVPAPRTVDFGSFRLFCSSACLEPRSIHRSIRVMDTIVGTSYNYYLHPYQWHTDASFSAFDIFCGKLAAMRADRRIRVARMCDVQD